MEVRRVLFRSRIEEYIEEGTPKQIHAQPRYITSSPSLKCVPSLKRRFLYTAAAVIALLVVSGVYWMSTLKRPDAPAITGTSEHIQDIPPGGNKAVLTLADGSKISLNEVSGGTLAMRSEEHTSELQSLMRISYAVFCLKKKKTTIQQTTTQQ